MINTLKKYNDIFMQNYSRGDENSKDIFKFNNKNSSLILTAPHSTRSFCNKKEKIADLYTGAIVKYLGEQNNISSIIRTKFTPYKALISDWIVQNNIEEHYFLDIHGFNQDINYDICLGIGQFEEQGYPYLQEIVKITKKYDLRSIVNHPCYCGIKGLTGRYQKIFNRPNVIQIEIKKELRDFFNHPNNIKNITIPFLTDVINLYKKNSDNLWWDAVKKNKTIWVYGMIGFYAIKKLLKGGFFIKWCAILCKYRTNFYDEYKQLKNKHYSLFTKK